MYNDMCDTLCDLAARSARAEVEIKHWTLETIISNNKSYTKLTLSYNKHYI